MHIFLFPGILQHIYVYLVIVNFFGLMCRYYYRKKKQTAKPVSFAFCYIQQLFIRDTKTEFMHP